MKKNLINHFKKAAYLVVFAGFSTCFAGSYEDYFVAIKKDDAAVVSELLARGFDANTPSEKGAQGLYLALQESSLAVAKALLAWPGTDINAKNLTDETPLMMAALKGQLDIATQLISKGADVNKSGWTALHYASSGGHNALVRLLIENHAYLDAESPNGTTPLMMAAFYGTPETVKILLEAGADPTVRNQRGMNALNFALNGSRSEAANLIALFSRSRPALKPKEEAGAVAESAAPVEKAVETNVVAQEKAPDVTPSTAANTAANNVPAVVAEQPTVSAAPVAPDPAPAATPEAAPVAAPVAQMPVVSEPGVVVPPTSESAGPISQTPSAGSEAVPSPAPQIPEAPTTTPAPTLPMAPQPMTALMPDVVALNDLQPDLLAQATAAPAANPAGGSDVPKVIINRAAAFEQDLSPEAARAVTEKLAAQKVNPALQAQNVPLAPLSNEASAIEKVAPAPTLLTQDSQPQEEYLSNRARASTGRGAAASEVVLEKETAFAQDLSPEGLQSAGPKSAAQKKAEIFDSAPRVDPKQMRELIYPELRNPMSPAVAPVAAPVVPVVPVQPRYFAPSAKEAAAKEVINKEPAFSEELAPAVVRQAPPPAAAPVVKPAVPSALAPESKPNILLLEPGTKPVVDKNAAFNQDLSPESAKTVSGIEAQLKATAAAQAARKKAAAEKEGSRTDK